MAFYKTVIQIEVISDGPYDFRSVYGLAYDTDEGDCSGKAEIVSSEKLTLEQLTEECQRHATDIEFFLGED